MLQKIVPQMFFLPCHIIAKFSGFIQQFGIFIYFHHLSFPPPGELREAARGYFIISLPISPLSVGFAATSPSRERL